MRTVAAPVDDPLDIYRLCAAGYSGDRNARLIAIELTVADDAASFDAKAPSADYHLVVARRDVNEGAITVTNDEMKALYSDKLADGPGRPVYDRLRSAARICPLCGQRVVSTLDHYLPKSKYPSLSVHPRNLIPACADCNKTKQAKVGTISDENTIHPYFDDITSLRWLYARVTRCSPVVIEYFVDPPIGMALDLARRVEAHMVAFGLAALFSTHAAEELTLIRERLLGLRRGSGFAGLRDYLEDEAESRLTPRVNNWNGALYDALARDPWFLESGVLDVPAA
ncbi:MAG: HNH endonuclease signature motif containing protein [Myxococcota bacterium]